MLANFAEDAGQLEDSESFRTFMASTASQYGFAHFTYIALRGPAQGTLPFAVSTFPDNWGEHYIAHAYVSCDPVLETAQAAFQPFDWAQCQQHLRLTERQRTVMRRARDFGVGQGMAIPVHGPNGAFAALSFACKETPKEFQRIQRAFAGELHAMALSFHAAIDAKLLRTRQEKAVHLTDRERDVLSWTARGKTSWESAEILGVSVETINFHAKNVMRKYDVASKHQAVVKAIMAGQIVP